MIKAEVIYTENHFKTFTKNNKYTKQHNIFVFILIAVNLIFILYCFIDNSNFFPYGNIVLLILFTVWTIYLNHFSYKKTFKAYKKRFPNAVITFTFTDDSLSAVTKGENFSENLEYGYDKFCSAKELKNYFILNLDKRLAYIISKSEIVEGTPAELCQFLKNKFGSRFKQKGTSS